MKLNISLLAVIFFILIASYSSPPRIEPTVTFTLPPPEAVGTPLQAPTLAPTATIKPWLDEIGKKCSDSLGQKKQEMAGQPEVPILVVMKSGEVEHWWVDTSLEIPELTTELVDEVFTILCIHETREVVGCYLQKGFQAFTSCTSADPRAIQYKWKVSLLDVESQQNLFLDEFWGGPPPMEITGNEGRGSRPVEEIRDWLADLFEVGS